jgi:hypothetical protein
MIKTLKTVAFLLPLTFCSIGFVGSTTPWATSWAAESQDIYYLKGDPPKKDLVNLKVKPSMDLAKVVSNFQQQYPRATAELIDEAQTTMNDLYKPGSSYGDKSSAFIVLLEQYKAGVGKEPVPIVGTTLHATKCQQYIVGLRKKAVAPLPPEAISSLQNEIQKMEEAIAWADNYKANNKPAIPKWAKAWKADLGG